MSIKFLSQSLNDRQRRLQLAAGLTVVAALGVLAYLSQRESDAPTNKQSHTTPLSSSEALALIAPTTGSAAEGKKVNLALPSVETVAASPALTKELAKTINNCRSTRIEDSIAGRPPGKDPFNGLGTNTNCTELFDRYGDRLDEALYNLRSSPDPVLRGYYYDANYDVISDRALSLQAVLPQGSPSRRAYEQLADAHFEDVARDLDYCSPDSVARMHLSQKLTSPQFANPAISYFTSLVLVAHDPADVKLRAYSNTVKQDSGLDPQMLAQIEASVIRGTDEGCGIGALGKELAFWKGFGGAKVTEDPPDELDTKVPESR